MVKIRCMKCNFSFEAKNNRNEIFCPNCGERENIIKEQSAEELIKKL